jgi:membrane protease YdiL (CAAX protease family)
MATSPTDTHGPPPSDCGPVAAWWHTIVFVIAMFAYGFSQFHLRARLATAHARNHLAIYVFTIVFEGFLQAYVWLLGFRPAGKSLREIIGGKWARFSDVLTDIGAALLFWVVVVVFLGVLRVIIGPNSTALQTIKVLLPQSPLELIVWVILSVTAGFCEEVAFRGYLQRQFLALTGMAPIAVVCQAIVFGSVHLYQGVKGAITITVYGALFGVLAVVRNSLRPGIIQHAPQDTFAGVVGSLLAKYKYI